ncbi:hypothetical protein A2X44_05120 [candidate division CPR3 bacterium GWF2_35_18]|uniref:D-fructose 1,6-bisphosphatase n=1 Tax=candidate division CPR3 bacterium GW2011_GWF2_35_18 TaxID=1618350 RepID=A0A0G0BK64_UNCC3|nr:MAG: D-fructose 1,6-bisphosphatase [candidate division CPR3 bacterium GW2011_GWF2_35_18]OGB63711.1 MAG: hypothetical protein A2X44_05120 [candidate division CPR3 bacterium GWF2_35_18]OGB64969.1 MAG: hypothetical protein A2250_00925 [candidate division CPR3 bacterium RIFOXYA2_FULL_35_13]OGB75532.1 MAG: hypothetical protein A2476_02505 [candidate division CPR3 bacterium RIFOXYC2_FULL_35_7]OGB78548.1 MAG: hypothetical protein A2296_02005 [candidate division CPR3 bacterium RIFOXYB2_FULL_35_8]
MSKDFSYHIKTILELAKETFQENQSLNKEIGIINVKGDEVLAMDKKMESVIIDYLRKEKLPVSIFSEEIGFLELHNNPTHLVVFDPLDGSTNYQIGQNLMPYGLMIAVYEGSTPKLSDIKASGMYEVTSKRGFIFDGSTTRNLEGVQISVNRQWGISAKTPVHFDLYYKEAVQKFGSLAQNVHLKWGGSNISSLLYVLSEIGAVMGSVKMRPEEIGAVASLINGANGIVVDLKGNNLMNYSFGVDSIYPFIAGNKEIVRYLIKEIN